MISLGILLLSSLLHPFHITYAEAQWNAEGSRLQVALRMSPMDLDNALSNTTGRRILLEQESAESKQKLVEAYLRNVIYLTSDKETGKPTAEQLEKRHRRFHWVGFEDELRYSWAYFELEVPAVKSEREVEPPTFYWLTHRVFFETEETQINTLQLMKTEPPIAIRTTRQEPIKKIAVVLPKNEVGQTD